MKPIYEKDASPELKSVYRSIREVLTVPNVPLPFLYMGRFPRYFDFIVPSLLENLKDEKFETLTDSIGDELKNRMKEYIPKDSDLISWIERYQYDPSFFQMQFSVKKVHGINVKLAFLFLALREAIKGWAVAVKRLESTTAPIQKGEKVELSHDAEDFVYEDPALDETSIVLRSMQTEPLRSTTSRNSTALVTAEDRSIEINTYVEYLRLCRNYFSLEVKKDQYVYFRVQAEQAILMALEFLPHPIISPINQISELVPDPKDYYDLTYLLSEHFPILSVQRMLFSGYMLV